MKRPSSHVTGGGAELKIRNHIPKEWICRKVEQDYGIDFEVEIVEGDDVTGARLWLQVKGTNKVKVTERSPFNVHARHTKCQPTKKCKCVTYSIETKMLKYALKCDVPVLLVVVDVKDERIFWLPLRDHIEMILDSEDPVWDTKKTVTLFIPFENSFSVEDAENYKGLRWYAAEVTRIRAFNMLTNCHVWCSYACEKILYISQHPKEPLPPLESLVPELHSALLYLKRALETECLFGCKGVEFFNVMKMTTKMDNAIKSAKWALDSIEKHNFEINRFMQWMHCISAGIGVFQDCSFTYQAVRRQYLFSTEYKFISRIQSNSNTSK